MRLGNECILIAGLVNVFCTTIKKNHFYYLGLGSSPGNYSEAARFFRLPVIGQQFLLRFKNIQPEFYAGYFFTKGKGNFHPHFRRPLCNFLPRAVPLFFPDIPDVLGLCCREILQSIMHGVKFLLADFWILITGYHNDLFINYSKPTYTFTFAAKSSHTLSPTFFSLSRYSELVNHNKHAQSLKVITISQKAILFLLKIIKKQIRNSSNCTTKCIFNLHFFKNKTFKQSIRVLFT